MPTGNSNNNGFVPTADMFQARDGSWRWRAGSVDEISGKPRIGAPFVRGAPSPNPTGRPKAENDHNNFIDKYILPEIERRLMETLSDPTTKPADLLTAYKLFMERRFGKPKQTTDHTISGGAPVNYQPMVIDASVLASVLGQNKPHDPNADLDEE